MSERAGHLGRFDALVERGWLGVLKHMELKLWLCYAKHANADGLAWPGSKRIGEYLQYANVGHIPVLRRRLAEHGLLTVVSNATAKRSARVRLLVPPDAPAKRQRKSQGAAAISDDDLPDDLDVTDEEDRIPDPATPESGVESSEIGTSETGAPARAHFVSPGAPKARAPSKDEEPIEEPREEPTLSAAPAAAAEDATATRGKRTRERKYTDAQVETFDAFWDWWAGIWPRFHRGDDYDFQRPKDPKAIWTFLGKRHVRFELERAKEIAVFFLEQPEIYGLYDHQLVVLAARANSYARKIDERKTGGSSHVLRPAAHAEPDAGANTRAGQFARPVDVPVYRAGGGGGGVAAVAG